MAEYIERKAAQQAPIELPADLDAEAVQRCIETVHNFPAANVRENVQPKTNADRIRAMSDEELAEWLASVTDCHLCPIDDCGGAGDMCTATWLDWLQSPAEGGGGA